MDRLIRLGNESFRTNGPIPFSRHADAGSAGNGNLPALIQFLGGDVRDSLAHVGNVVVSVQRVREGAHLFHEGAKAVAVYVVAMGSFKSFHTTEDGYEQVVGFSNRKDVLGFDSIHVGRHVTSAVALEEARVYAIAMEDVHQLGRGVPDLDRALHVAVSNQLQRYGELVDLMSAVAAEARLGRFLLQLSQRMTSLGQSPHRLYLRMSRRDIASYLGLAHETVSRSFGALARAGYLVVNRREVDILDMEGLRMCARGTRRASHEQQGSITPKA